MMNEERQKSCPEVKQIGITELFVPEDGNILADLIFVHGLKGHPRKTWEYGSSKTHLTISPFRRSSKDLEGCYWPSDLLPANFNKVRILTYGYDSHPSHFYKSTTNQMTISQHGRDLLVRVANSRQDCLSRPLIFIAHSLGGILVKDAVVESKKYVQQPQMQAIAKQCRAIFFFGTPHQGSSFAEWGLLLNNIIGTLPGGLSMYKGLLRGLSPESEKLDGLTRDFNDILNANVPVEQKIKLFTFQEGKGIGRLASLDGKVVPDTSSSFGRRDLEISSFVHENHMNMCRFKDESDPTYVDFRAKLSNLLDVLPKPIGALSRGKGAFGDSGSGNRHDNIIDILEKLEFEGRRLRETQLGDLQTHKETFNWIWDSMFADWLTQGEQIIDNIFWIYGKPASGKSTLMHYISDTEALATMLHNSTQRRWSFVYHFFDFRAAEGIRNNFEGFLRSLLYQLLEQSENIVQKHTVKLMDQHSIRHLRQALETILKQSPTPILLLLDGLDEFKGNQWELVQFLRQSAGSNVRICLASRPEPVFEAAFEKVPKLKMQDFNRAGIEHFVTLTLERSLLDSSFFDDDKLISLSHNIGQRADGMFLWARFATYELAEGYACGEDFSALERRLEQLPPELEDVYSRIFRKLKPLERHEAGRMLQLICSAARTLNIEELMAAMQHVRGKSGFRLTKVSTQICRQFERNIMSITGGVLQIFHAQPKSKASYTFGQREFITAVGLTHKTVRTYLDSRGWQELLPGSHDGLMHSEALWTHVCAGQFVSEINGPDWVPDQLPQDRSGDPCSPNDLDFMTSLQYSAPLSSIPATAEDCAPLREYAALYIFRHAATFEHTMQSPALPLLKESITCSLLRFHWAFGFNIDCFCRCIADDYISVIPRRLLHVTVAHGLVRSVSMQLTKDMSLGSMDCQNHKLPSWLPKYDLARYNSVEIAGLEMPNNYDLLETSSECLESFSAADEEMSILEHAVRVVAWNGDLTLLDNILQNNPPIDDSAKIAALATGNVPISSSLLPNAAGWKCRFVPEQDPHTFRITPLRIEEVLLKPLEVELLSNLRIAEPFFTPLWILIRHTFRYRPQLNEQKFITFLQERREEMNGQCGPFGTAMHSAIGHNIPHHILKVLIKAGGDVHAKGLLGNPLEYAWRFLNSDNDDVQPSLGRVVRMLIENGAVNKRMDPNGCVPTQEWMLCVSRLAIGSLFSSPDEEVEFQDFQRCRDLYASSEPYPTPLFAASIRVLNDSAEGGEEDDDNEDDEDKQIERS